MFYVPPFELITLILPYPIVVTSDKIMHGEDALAHVLRGEKQLVIPFSFL